MQASGWETGLKLVDCEEWTIEDCNFSNNFHDPDFGWGENGRRGGIVLERTNRSLLRRNHAHNVWDACVLVDSHQNTLEQNDFSHTSNTCLKLWQATRNTIRDNNFSYGIRKKPDEVHARDSTGVLIESGSNDNRFINNDCTYGGDGIFVRVLNRWCSTGNVFENNDCSYANNNGFECWAPRNIFVRNKANHCSYGFWLGGSDQTILIENEASHNGLLAGNHNSPHLPGNTHAGIVFMFGPSSHVLARGNRCEHNHGAGIALIGDLDSQGHKWKAYHWLLDSNHLHANDWGVFARYADWIRLENNHLTDNRLADIENSLGVSRFTIASEPTTTDDYPSSLPEPIPIIGPNQASLGQTVRFTLAPTQESIQDVHWDLGNEQHREGITVERSFEQAGFYRIGVTVTFHQAPTQIGWLDFYVTDSQNELATDPNDWSFQQHDKLNCVYKLDQRFAIAGKDCVEVAIDPYHGQLAWLTARLGSANQQVSTTGKQVLVFWLKSINPNLPGWQSNNPEIRLRGEGDVQLTLKPKKDLFSQAAANEARDGWQMFVVPLSDSPDWERSGQLPQYLSELSIGVDSWDAGPLRLWIDGIVLR